MSTRLPDTPISGETIDLEFFHATNDHARAVTPQSGRGTLMSGDTNGAPVSLPFQIFPAQPPPAQLASFRVYNASDSTGAKIGCTGGKLQFISLGIVVAVDALDPTEVADGDMVWIEFTGQGDDLSDWTITTGSEYPTDVFYIPLVNDVPVSTDDNDNEYVDWSGDGSEFDWTGGDIPVQETFYVTVEGDDSADVGEAPDYTSVTTLNGIDLVDAIAAFSNPLDSNLQYGAGTEGIAGFKDDGTFWCFVFDEYPLTTTDKLVTNVSFDGTTLTQTKQEYGVFDINTDSEDTPIDTPTDCPDT